MSVPEYPRIIVITGSESTGKTELTRQLAHHYHAPYYPEYAREYISGLNRKYNVQDVELIAGKQIEQYDEASHSKHKYVFFDTWLIITKVWFEVVYNKVPDWLTDSLKSARITGFIVNEPDLPWVSDPLRENGGKMREILHQTYLRNLEYFKFRYCLNTGFGPTRLANAIKTVENNFING